MDKKTIITQIKEFFSSTEEKFEKDYISTIGVNILIKDIDVEMKGDQYAVQLMFWDIGGQEKYTNVRHMFYKGANGAILVYDTTRPNTFLQVPEYLEDLETYLGKRIPFILIGNKIDLTDLYKVPRENAEKLKETTNALAFFETSAKTGENVDSAFVELGGKVVSGKGDVEMDIKKEEKKMSPAEAMDNIVAHFIEHFHQETDYAMSVVRKQCQVVGLDITNPSKMAMNKFIDRLAIVEADFLSQHEVNKNKIERKAFLTRM